MARNRSKESSEDSGMNPLGWMLTFGDLTTLLLTFFVLLLTMSSMDDKQFKEAFGMIVGPPELVLQGGGGQIVEPPELATAFVPPPQMPLRTERDILITFEDFLKKRSDDGVKIFPSDKGIVLKFEESVLFEKFKADLTAEAKELLDSMIPVIERIELNMIVEGLSDDEPLPTDSKFVNSLDLSAQRALTVLGYLLQNSSQKESRFSCRGLGAQQDTVAVDGEAESNNSVQIIIDTNISTLPIGVNNDG